MMTNKFYQYNSKNIIYILIEYNISLNSNIIDFYIFNNGKWIFKRFNIINHIAIIEENFNNELINFLNVFYNTLNYNLIYLNEINVDEFLELNFNSLNNLKSILLQNNFQNQNLLNNLERRILSIGS